MHKILPLAFVLLAGASLTHAADEKKAAIGKKKDQASSSSDSRDTVAAPLSAREQRKRDDRLRTELSSTYGKWMSEEVGYIITDEERAAFTRLSTDDEREQFVTLFWLRRDPTPDTEENEFKEEHYRRIAYANEHYASGVPGWKSDRGQIYIRFGPPDEIDPHASGGTYQRPPEEGGGTTSTFPFEKWRYRFLDGVGSDINIEFVDRTMSGEYRMTIDPSEKDALAHVPRPGRATQAEAGSQSLPASANPFERLRVLSDLQKARSVKFKDLESVVSVAKFNLLPMKVRYDVIPLTSSSILTSFMMQFDRRDLQFKSREGISQSTIQIHCADQLDDSACSQRI